MREIIHHILIVLLLLSVSIPLCAQDIDLDKQLDRYELLCMRCQELKLRTSLEGAVPKQEAQSLINSFLNQNKILKAAQSQMSPVQRRRFSAISSWFSTGRFEPISDIDEIPHLEDIPSPQYLAVKGSGIAHKTTEYQRIPLCDIYVLATLSAPDFAYGMMLGCKFRRNGIYARFDSNYRSCSTSYSCTSDGYSDNGGRFWASGRSARANLGVSAGPMFGLGRGLTLYGGIGYGHAKVAWEDVDGEWAAVSDISHSGILVDCGLVYSWESLLFSLGAKTVGFRTASLTCGVGVAF